MRVLIIIISVLGTMLLCGCQHRHKPSTALLIQQPAFYHIFPALVAGNSQGRFTVVEFFDYRCHACADAFPALQQLLLVDPRVRIVYREIPFLGVDSVFAARAALASVLQGKYIPFHDALMAVGPALDSDTVMLIAKRLGLNLQKLKMDMQSSVVTQQLIQNKLLADKLHIDGTPVYLVAQTTWKDGTLHIGQAVELQGAQSFDQLKNIIVQLND